MKSTWEWKWELFSFFSWFSAFHWVLIFFRSLFFPFFFVCLFSLFFLVCFFLFISFFLFFLSSWHWHWRTITQFLCAPACSCTRLKILVVWFGNKWMINTFDNVVVVANSINLFILWGENYMVRRLRRKYAIPFAYSANFWTYFFRIFSLFWPHPKYIMVGFASAYFTMKLYICMVICNVIRARRKSRLYCFNIASNQSILIVDVLLTTHHISIFVL